MPASEAGPPIGPSAGVNRRHTGPCQSSARPLRSPSVQRLVAIVFCQEEEETRPLEAWIEAAQRSEGGPAVALAQSAKVGVRSPFAREREVCEV